VYSAVIVSAVSFLTVLISTNFLVKNVSAPLDKIQEIISFASHNNRQATTPKIESIKVGRDLVTAQSLQIYDLASSTINLQPNTTNTQDTVSNDPSHHLIDLIPFPVIGLDKNKNVVMANKLVTGYLGKNFDDIVAKPLDDNISLSFQVDETLNDWLIKVNDNSIVADKCWEGVRNDTDKDNIKQFDLYASYSKNNDSGIETILALIDKTEKYNLADGEISFVALAVHELRTPLTIMRGYIEVFEDELSESLTPELQDFMHKMHASSQQLTAFVSNILNIARIEENQLVLKLRSEIWSEILSNAVDDLQLRAGVRNINIELSIQDNIPPVAADRISIHEVINNLVDNAIKYSGESTKIIIKSQLNSEGMIETEIQDFGIGIPESVMGKLFQKYQRSHKTSAHIGGTGLGLYLCKSLVGAHGGNIWVRSKEGEGSVFSFTLLPFDRVSKEQAAGEDGIIRGAHGWIKNHSLYRN